MDRLKKELGISQEQKYFYDQQGIHVTGEVDNLLRGDSTAPVVMDKQLVANEMARANTLQQTDYSGMSSGEGGAGGIWTVPDTGSRLPSGIGGFTYDFTRNEIYKPGYDPQVAPMITEGGGIPSNYLRSLTIILDDHANARILPGGAKFLVDACFIWTMPLRNIQILHIVPPTVFVAQLVMSNTNQPVNPLPMSYSQERELPVNTVTKTNGPGVADNWTAVSGWLASDGPNRGPANTKNFIHLMSYPTKNFQFKNTGATDIEIYLEGWNLGGQTFEVPDPTTGTPGSVTIPAGEVANFQVNNYYHFMRVLTRIPAVHGAGTSSTIIGAYRGNTQS